MIIFLYGRDGYRLKENLEKIAAEYRKKHASGMSFSVLDADSQDASYEMPSLAKKLEDIVKTVSFFNEKKLIVLKNAFAFSDDLGQVIRHWDLVGDKEHILVFTENLPGAELAKRDKKFFTLLTAKPNMAKEFEPLSGKKLGDWAAKEAAGLDAIIEVAAIKKLISFVGNDSWRLRLELEKLANYSEGHPVTASVVELLVSPTLDLNIFDTIDAIGARNKIRALTLVQRHLEAGEDPYYLFSMIVYQFRNLLRVKSLAQKYLALGDIVKKTGLHPFVARKIFDQAKRFELNELKAKFSQLAEGDVKIKDGQVDIVDYLYQVALS